MLQKILRDLQVFFDPKPVYRISSHIKDNTLEYPFIFEESLIRSGKRQGLIKSFDENGIPLNTSYIDVEGNKLDYYPITIGQVGLSVYQTYLKTESENDLDRFFKFSDWYMDNKIEDKYGTYWLTNVPKPEYKIFKPWKSAFTQIRAISILMRAYIHNSNTEYLKSIDRALDILYLSNKENGVTEYISNSVFFFEEYPTTEPTLVLDGHLFVLIGLIDIVKVDKKLPKEIVDKASDLFQKGLNGLTETFDKFDMGFWLKFNLCEMNHYPKVDPCTVGYMKLIKEQLNVLYHFTGNNTLRDFSMNTKKYLTVINTFKMYMLKYKTLKELNRV